MIGAVLVFGFAAVGLGALLSALRRGFAAGLVVQAVGASAMGAAGFWLLAAGVRSGPDSRARFVLVSVLTG